jgi:hypothetical protein
MMIKMLIKRAAAALRADETQARNRADACSSNSFFSPSVHVTCGSAPNNAFSPSDVKASAVKLHQCSTRWKLGQWGDLNEAPLKSDFDQVHVASTASEPNLAKTRVVSLFALRSLPRPAWVHLVGPMASTTGGFLSYHGSRTTKRSA